MENGSIQLSDHGGGATSPNNSSNIMFVNDGAVQHPIDFNPAAKRRRSETDHGHELQRDDARLADLELQIEQSNQLHQTQARAIERLQDGHHTILELARTVTSAHYHNHAAHLVIENNQRSNLDQLKQENDELKQDNNELKQTNDELKQESNELKQDADELKQEINGLKRLFSENEVAMADLIQENSESRRHNVQLNDNLTNLTESYESISQKMSENQAAMAHLTQQNSEFLRHNVQLNDNIADLTKRCEILSREMGQKNEEAIFAMQAEEALAAKTVRQKQKLEDQQKIITQLKDDNKQLKSEIDQPRIPDQSTTVGESMSAEAHSGQRTKVNVLEMMPPKHKIRMLEQSIRDLKVRLSSRDEKIAALEGQLGAK